jgi:hypothetical protein
MGGGLMQLVAYGAQDIYLTGNPQITFFKVVYRRHTNFSMETIQQTLNGAATAVANAQSTCTISRNGDLVYKTYVSFVTLANCDNGSKIIKEVELEIGGQRIDRHYQEWNEVWNELSTSESKAIGLKAMQLEVGTTTTGVVEALIPLNFWFCRNPGLALPLIALQYHEVKLKFTWDTPVAAGTATAAAPKVWCDYIYLDTDERRRFAQVSHEYLIEQIQKEDKTLSASVNEKLNFNHPVKELIWTYPSAGTLTKGKLMLNGHDRFSEQSEEYFTLRQPFDYHTAVPRQNLPSSAQLAGNYVDFADSTLTAASTLGDASGHVTSIAVGSLSAGVLEPDVSEVKWGVTNHTALNFVAASTFAGSAASAINVDSTAFAFELSSLGVTTEVHFRAGVVYKVTAYGAAWTPGGVTGGATLALKSSTIVRAVRVVAGSGNNSAGTVNSDTTLVYFDKQMVTGATAAGTLVITDIQEVTPNSSIVTQARTSQMTRKVGVYSFALKPEEHQPSGTCNFSRIDNAKLQFTSSATSGDLKVYAVNYNVLRIMSGMGGLAYSN